MSEWRLPRSTPNLIADHLAVMKALNTATTDDQRAACALRLQDIGARWERHNGRLAERMAAALRPVVEAMAVWAKAVQRAHANGPWARLAADPPEPDRPPPPVRRRPHNHGPAPRPGRRTGNVPGARQ